MKLFGYLKQDFHRELCFWIMGNGIRCIKDFWDRQKMKCGGICLNSWVKEAEETNGNDRFNPYKETTRVQAAQWLNSEVHIIVDSKRRVINLKTTSEITVDCGAVLNLVRIIKLGILFGNRVYGIHSIINYAEKLGIKTVIPSKSNRKSKRNFDSDLYCLRYIVENTFLKFKRWCGIAILHFKTSIAFISSLLFVLFPSVFILDSEFVYTIWFFPCVNSYMCP